MCDSLQYPVLLFITSYQLCITSRSLRSDSIPSSRDVALSYDAGRGRGVGFLLSQCLSGGVFRWLMLACGEDIEKVIQVENMMKLCYVLLGRNTSVAI
jgi:hypothetical protein